MSCAFARVRVAQSIVDLHFCRWNVSVLLYIVLICNIVPQQTSLLLVLVLVWLRHCCYIPWTSFCLPCKVIVLQSWLQTITHIYVYIMWLNLFGEKSSLDITSDIDKNTIIIYPWTYVTIFCHVVNLNILLLLILRLPFFKYKHILVPFAVYSDIDVLEVSSKPKIGRHMSFEWWR